MATDLKSEATPQLIAAMIAEGVSRPDAIAYFERSIRPLIRLGHSRESIVAEFEAAALRFRERKCDHQEEIVLEVLDRLAGWCAPDRRL